MTDMPPGSPSFRSIRPEDKELFDKALRKLPYATSEMTFTNFYIWRECDRSKMALINGNICVYAEPENEPPYFFEPVGGNMIPETIDECAKIFPRFSRISPDFTKEHFEGKAKFKIEADRNNADYIYNTSDLIDLKGKRYDGKRNKIRKFLKNNIPVFQEIRDDDVPGCVELIKRWEDGKRGGICFDVPMKEALKSRSMLGLKGATVRINGKIEAFTLGERIGQDTAIIYIEVANPEIDGLSQYVNQHFSKDQWSDTKFINRESDLGDAGLRRAKMSYQPVKMIDKYTVTVVDEIIR